MLQGGNPFLDQSTPMPRFIPFHGGSVGGNPGFPLGNQIGGCFPPFNKGPQGFIRSNGSITNSFRKPGASYNPRPSFQDAH
jgi:hypothetical protein